MKHRTKAWAIKCRSHLVDREWFEGTSRCERPADGSGYIVKTFDTRKQARDWLKDNGHLIKPRVVPVTVTVEEAA